MERMSNAEMKSILPDVHMMLSALEDKKFTEYEDKLAEATDKSIDCLNGIIEDGTLALDPEQTVNAVKVLTQARRDIIESKRRLIDTCIKGEVMIEALNQNNKKDNGNSALLEYLERNKLDTSLDKTGTSPGSVFETIMQNNELEDEEQGN